MGSIKGSECKVYFGDKCIGEVENVEIPTAIHTLKNSKSCFSNRVISGTIRTKNIKCGKGFRDMMKRLYNRLEAYRLHKILKRTRKPRIKKKLVKRIVELI